MNEESDRRVGAAQRQRAEELLMARLRRPVQSLANRTPAAKSPAQRHALSSAQERMWFLHVMEPESAAYNVTSAARFTGPLNVEILRKSVRFLVLRHEMLRSVFPSDASGPYRMVREHTDTPFTVTDLSTQSRWARDRELGLLLDEHAADPFDVQNGPLIRFAVLRVGDDDHLVAVTMHHIIADGWSLGVLHRDFAEAYRALLAGRGPDLPPVGPAFDEIVDREQILIHSPAGESDRDYWRGVLAGVPQLELPMATPRPPVARFVGARCDVHLPEDFVMRLEELGRRHGASLYMVAAAAFNCLLHRYSGQAEIIFGSPVANRDDPRWENTIALFVNTVVLRVDVSADPTFTEVLQRVRTATLQALSHQRIPFEQVVGDVVADRFLSHNPLFQVMFALQNAKGWDLELDGLVGQPVHPETATVRLDLECSIWRRRDGLDVRLTYNTDIFAAEVVQRIAGHYRTILSAIVEEPDASVGTIRYLSAAEDARLARICASDPPVTTPGCLHRAVEQLALQTPDAEAVESPDGLLTFAELNGRANQVACELVDAGVRRGDVVGICTQRSTDLVVAVLGVLKSGAAFLPLNPEDPLARLRFTLTDAGARLVLTDRHQPEADLPARWVELADIARQCSTVSPMIRVEPDDLAYVIYTSGTTGQPKGVAVEHRQVANTLAACQEYFGFAADDVGLVIAPATFDVFYYELLSVLLAGGRSRLVTRQELFDPWRMVHLLRGATAFQGVPGVQEHLLRTLADQGVDQLPTMRHVVTGGDRVPAGLVRTLQEVFPRAHVAVTYGPTETAIFATAYTPTGAGPTVGHPIGRPLPGVEVRIADAAGRLLPEGVAGEIWIAGRGVSRGYLNRPDETATRFATLDGRRWYRSGDRARLRPDGVIEFLDRADDQVKVRGHRIELGEVESVLAQAPGVRQAVVTTQGQGPSDRRLVAFAVADTDDVLANAAGGGHGSGEQRLVAQWQQLFDQTHDTAADPADRDFSGWNNSYNGQPLAAEDMNEWLDTTLRRIRAKLAATSDREGAPSILEIGCGTGLLVLELAAQSARYVATDFSASVISRLRSKLAGRDLPQVELVECVADGLPDMGAGFDAVIINSVAQYLPNPEYLQRVLDTAASLLAPEDGFVFVGDVRSLPLLGTFATGVQAARSPELPATELLERAAHRAADEDELVLHPEFFLDWAQRTQSVCGLEVEPRDGIRDNELVKYRYDVTLWRRPGHRVAEPQWQDWTTHGWDLAALADVLQREAPDHLALLDIPHALLQPDLEHQAWLHQQAGRTTGGAPSGVGVLPEQLREIGSRHGYLAVISWLDSGAAGAFHAYLCPEASVMGSGCHLALRWPRRNIGNALANDPLRRAAQRRFGAKTREFLATRLPDYMLPAAVLILDELPLTSHGKVDRTALPTVRIRDEPVHRDPATPAERLVQAAWQETLDLDTSGVTDDFFAVGGTSLLAIQLTVGLRARGVQLVPQRVFELRTIARIAESLDGANGVPTPIDVARREPVPAVTATSDTPRPVAAPVVDTRNANGMVKPSGDQGKPWTVVTGATGMLGIHLLNELLRTEPEARVVCLVRAADDDAAQARLLDQYRWYFPDTPLRESSPGPYVRAVAADLTEGHLGLSSAQWHALAADCDRIVHAAADVRHVAEESEIFAVNRDGTQRLLDLSRAGGCRFLHISSVAVAGRMHDPKGQAVLAEHELDIGQTPTEPYSASKLAAERSVREFVNSGGEALVFRVGTVAPHSVSGRFQRNIDDHFFSRFVRAVVDLGVATDWSDRRFALTPADVMARIVCALDAKSGAERNTFHIQTPRVLPHGEVVRMLQAAGYMIRVVPADEFTDVLLNLGRDARYVQAVGRMLPLLTPRRGRPVRLDDSWTSTRLAELGLTYPRPTASWMQRFLHHAVDVGYLPPPGHAEFGGKALEVPVGQ